MDEVTEPERIFHNSNMVRSHSLDTVASDYLYHSSLSHQDALEDFGQVSEVEGVMGLGWSWEELGGDGGVDSDSSSYKRLIQRLDYWHRC